MERKERASWALSLVLVAVLALLIFDLVTRHQKMLKPSAELDLYVFGVHAPWLHDDPFRPKGYVWSVYLTTFRLFHDALAACKAFNVGVFVLTSLAAFRWLRRDVALFAAFVLAMASGRMLEHALAAAADFVAVCAVFLVWILGVASQERERDAPFLGLGAIATLWACSIRSQNVIILLLGAASCWVAIRRELLPRRLLRYLGAVSLSCVLAIPLVSTPGNWRNIAIGVVARWENHNWPDLGRVSWDPRFFVSAKDFFAVPDIGRSIAANWLFNVQTGILRFLFAWPIEMPEFPYPPAMSLVFTVLLLIAWLRNRPKDAAFLGVRSLFLGHLGAYLVFAVAFLTDRFVLYALPLAAYLLLRLVENDARLRRAVYVIGAAFACFSLWDFAQLYREQVNPYSNTYLQLSELPLPTWTVAEREGLARTPGYAQLLPRPLLHPFVSIKIETPDAREIVDYDWSVNYIPPSFANAPERSRIFLTRKVAADPSRYVLRFVKDGHVAFELPLAQAPLQRL